jgi:hypothetical protein
MGASLILLNVPMVLDMPINLVRTVKRVITMAIHCICDAESSSPRSSLERKLFHINDLGIIEAKTNQKTSVALLQPSFTLAQIAKSWYSLTLGALSRKKPGVEQSHQVLFFLNIIPPASQRTTLSNRSSIIKPGSIHPQNAAAVVNALGN